MITSWAIAVGVDLRREDSYISKIKGEAESGIRLPSSFLLVS